jgi:hypothetical protein
MRLCGVVRRSFDGLSMRGSMRPCVVLYDGRSMARSMACRCENRCVQSMRGSMRTVDARIDGSKEAVAWLVRVSSNLNANATINRPLCCRGSTAEGIIVLSGDLYHPNVVPRCSTLNYSHESLKGCGLFTYHGLV